MFITLIVWLLSCAPVSAQQTTPPVTQLSDTVLLAFSPTRSHMKRTYRWEQMHGASKCTKLITETLTQFSVIACLCVTSDLVGLDRAAERYARKFNLQRLRVSGESANWIVSTREVKLLTAGSNERSLVISRLKGTPYVISPLDQKSPYRIFVRRRDQKVPTDYDLKRLKARVVVAVEIETISISLGN